ncbi:MAG: nuclear transport factor 2 family protein [Geodermatophilaceae bacterium]|nr:nuclear transport factor 2 family protein [Geodermatophilaceae bacterium]
MTSTVLTQDEAQIRQLITAKETLMRTRDANGLVSRYAPEIVQYDLAPPLQHSGPAVLDPSGVRGWFATFDGPLDYEVRDLAVTAGEDVAFCTSLERLTATPLGSSESFTLWVRTTVGLRKFDGTWRITHEHSSTPFYMDGSFKAAVDLQP